MATSVQIHEAIGLVLEGVSGLRGYATPPSGATPPFAFPALLEWKPETFGRTGAVITATFDLYVITAQIGRPQDGYNLLQSYTDWSGDLSIYQALWAANGSPPYAFGGLANTQCVALEYRQIGTEEASALQGFGGALTLTVKTKES